MKKFLLGCLLLGAISATAQDVKSVKKALEAKDLAKAQQEVDALVAKDEKKPDSWYWKHKVYAAIAESETQKNLVPTPLKTGFEAFKKFFYLDKNMKAMILDGATDFTAVPLTYRQKFVNIGAAQLDAKNYTESYENLKSALTVYDFLVKEKMISGTLDTSIVFYTGYSAMNAKNNEGAEIYFKKIVDASAKATDLQIAYGWLANYYLNEKKDKAKGDAVLAKGLELYPNDDYLVNLKNNAIATSGDWNAIFANHEQTIAKPTAEFKDYLTYAANLFEYIYIDSVVSATDKLAKTPKFEELINKCLQMKPNSGEANFWAGMQKTQKTLEIDTKIKALKKNSTPANLEMVKKLNAEKLTLADACIKNFELTSSLYRSKGDKLTDTDKERYKIVLNNLVYFYGYKKMDDKAKEYNETLKGLK